MNFKITRFSLSADSEAVASLRASAALRNLLPEMLPEEVSFEIHPFQGKPALLRKYHNVCKAIRTYPKSRFKRNFPQNEITESLHRGNSSHFLILLTGYIFESDSVNRISWRSPLVPNYCDLLQALLARAITSRKSRGNMGTHFLTTVAKIFIWQGFCSTLVRLYGESSV